MKTISVRDLQKRIRECVDLAQKEAVVLARHGRPAAVVIGVEGEDWEDVFYRTSPEFRRMIQKRRKGRMIPMAEMIRRVEARWARAKRRRRGSK